MARYTGADCRLCRREGAKLFLKGDRCYTEKCAIERRNYAPGEAGKKRIKESEYRNQLREKQKTKRIYGVLEKQFRHYYDMANRQKGVTGENLLRILESRLDNVVYRLGFAKSRAEARQQVRHGHITVNGRRVDIPSFRVKPGDLVAVAPKAADLLVIKSALISNERVQVPAWLEVDIEKLQVVYLLFRSAIKSIWTFASSSSSNFTRNNRGIVRRLIPHDRVHEAYCNNGRSQRYCRAFHRRTARARLRLHAGQLHASRAALVPGWRKATAIQIEGVQHESRRPRVSSRTSRTSF